MFPASMSLAEIDVYSLLYGGGMPRQGGVVRNVALSMNVLVIRVRAHSARAWFIVVCATRP